MNQARIFKAIRFAALHHGAQMRKQNPSIHVLVHLMEVAELLADLAFPGDVLVAAILHDVVEDTPVTLDGILEEFGKPVAELVAELTDDPQLDDHAQKLKQIETAPHKSSHAKAIKLADKISNLLAVRHQPDGTWPHDKRTWYLQWSRQVAEGLSGVHPALDQLYQKAADELHGHLHTPSPSGANPDLRK